MACVAQFDSASASAHSSLHVGESPSSLSMLSPLVRRTPVRKSRYALRLSAVESTLGGTIEMYGLLSLLEWHRRKKGKVVVCV